MERAILKLKALIAHTEKQYQWITGKQMVWENFLKVSLTYAEGQCKKKNSSDHGI